MQHARLPQQSLVEANATADVASKATAAVILTIFDFIWNSIG